MADLASAQFISPSDRDPEHDEWARPQFPNVCKMEESSISNNLFSYYSSKHDGFVCACERNYQI